MDQEERQRNYERAEILLAEQNFGMAFIVGLFAMVIAAIVYGLLTMVAGGFAYGFMATGIGIIIGLAMQFAGEGIANKFAMLAGGFAIVGCVSGNIVATVIQIARFEQITLADVFVQVPPGEMLAQGLSALQYADLIFWIVASGAAAWLSKRPLSREDSLAIHMLQMRG